MTSIAKGPVWDLSFVLNCSTTWSAFIYIAAVVLSFLVVLFLAKKFHESIIISISSPFIATIVSLVVLFAFNYYPAKEKYAEAQNAYNAILSEEQISIRYAQNEGRSFQFVCENGQSYNVNSNEIFDIGTESEMVFQTDAYTNKSQLRKIVLTTEMAESLGIIVTK